MAEAGASVISYEPYKPNAVVEGVRSAASLDEAIQDAEVLVLLAGHRQFRDLDPLRLREVTSARLAIDTVGGWEKRRWLDAGFRFVRLGDGKR